MKPIRIEEATFFLEKQLGLTDFKPDFEFNIEMQHFLNFVKKFLKDYPQKLFTCQITQDTAKFEYPGKDEGVTVEYVLEKQLIQNEKNSICISKDRLLNG